MKQAFKNICIFLSAIFLLTACSDDDDEYHHFLSGTTVDGSETFNFSELEIIGLNREDLIDWDSKHGNHTYYRCRMRLSITPSERPVYREHKQRYRFLELISRERLDSDSIVVATSMEDYIKPPRAATRVVTQDRANVTDYRMDWG